MLDVISRYDLACKGTLKMMNVLLEYINYTKVCILSLPAIQHYININSNLSFQCMCNHESSRVLGLAIMLLSNAPKSCLLYPGYSFASLHCKFDTIMKMWLLNVKQNVKNSSSRNKSAFCTEVI